MIRILSARLAEGPARAMSPSTQGAVVEDLSRLLTVHGCVVSFDKYGRVVLRRATPDEVREQIEQLRVEGDHSSASNPSTESGIIDDTPWT